MCTVWHVDKYIIAFKLVINSRRISRGPVKLMPGPGGWGTLPYTMGTGSFPRVKRPGRGIEHPPLSSADAKERVELYLYSPFGPSWPILGWTLPFTFTLVCGVMSFGEWFLTFRSKVLPPSARARQPKKKFTEPLSRRYCQFLEKCFSTAGPQPGTGPQEVLEFVILVF